MHPAAFVRYEEVTRALTPESVYPENLVVSKGLLDSYRTPLSQTDITTL